MHWLSAGVEDLLAAIERGNKPDYDVIVVGSGYGGAVAASRYARAGLRVCVLERGREYVPGEFPNDIATLPRHVRLERADNSRPIGRSDALFDVRAGADVTVLVGSALGGTSQINANVALRADPEVLRSDPWPRAFRDEGASLDPYYTLAERMLGINPMPGVLGKREALFELGRHVARHVRRWVHDESSRPDTQSYCAPIAVTLADGRNEFGVRQNACVRCGDCVTGCNYGAKNTLTMNYLADARAHGAQLWTGAGVVALEPLQGGGARVYFGSYDSLPFWERGKRAPKQLRDLAAPKVVLAAGSLGSTEILLRSRELGLMRVSETLGTRFSGNGDALAFGFEQDARVGGIGWGWRQRGRDATGSDGRPLAEVGPTITGVIDTRRGVPRERAVVIQDGAIPGPLVKFFQELLTTAASVEQLDRFVPLSANGGDPAAPRPRTLSHSQTLLAMGHDDAAGRLRLAHDRLVVDWPSAPSQAVTQWQSELMALSRKLGGVYLFNPLHRPLPGRVAEILSGPELRGTPIVVHPLGGCPMAERCDLGVVDDRGRVFDCAAPRSYYKGLFVWDGSIIPGSLGVNPFLTITALAERDVALDLAADKRAQQHAHSSAVPAALKPADPPPVAAYRPPDAQVTTLEWQETLRGKLRGFGAPAGAYLNAELRVSLPMADIDGFLASPGRRLELRPSRKEGVVLGLRLAPPAPQGDAQPEPRRLKLEEGGWFAFLQPAPKVLDLLPRLLWRWLPTFAAVAWKRRFDILRWLAGRGPSIPWGSILQLLYRATEVREMRYVVRLREGAARFVLCGRKRFAQRCGDNVWYRLVALDAVLWRAIPLGSWWLPVFPMRWGRLTLDSLDLVDDRRPEFAVGVDLVNAFQSLARLPLFIMRALFPIYWWDFGLPEYPSRDRSLPRLPGPQRVVAPDGKGGYAAPKPEMWIEPERHWIGVHTSLGADGKTPSKETVRLVLSRYQPRDAAGAQGDRQRVLLLHGFGQSALGFAVDTIPANIIEVLLHEGFEVWLLDYRTSIALPTAYRQHDLDQVASIDVPEAVRYVSEFGRQAPQPIDVVGHCMGGAVLAMSLLEGRLQFPTAGGFERRVRKAVISQVPPFIVGGASAQARRQIAAFVRDAIGWPGVDLAADDGAGALWTAIDRLLSSFPARSWHEDREHDETCPGEHRWFVPRTDTATCKRVTAIVGRIFRHANINSQTHERLDRLFGWCNIAVFNQIAKFFDYERIVNSDGVNCYLTEKAMRAHLNFPIAFVHGKENELFDLESSRRSVRELESVNGTGNYALIAVEDYGHYDCMIGTQAHRRVFAPIADFLRNFQGQAHATEPTPIELRVPRLGPLLGWVRDEDGRPVATLWAKPDPAATPTPIYALTALYDAAGNLVEARRWPLLGSQAACAAGTLPSCIDEDGQPIALADIPVPAQGGDHRVRMLFAYPTAHGQGASSADAGQPQPEPPNLPRGSCARQAKTMQDIEAALKEFRALPPLAADDARRAVEFTRQWYEEYGRMQERKVKKILSRVKRRRIPFEDCEALLPERLLSARTQRNSLRFFAGTCRYPGTLIDSARSDAVFGAMRARLKREEGPAPQFLLMCGDQIYADANAAVFNVTSRLEKFSVRYRDAWGSPQFRRLARELPLYMVMDDHEIDDGWSNDRPYPAQDRLIGWSNERATPGRDMLREWGRSAFLAYQRSHGPRDALPASGAFDFSFEASGLGFYVLDTRSERWTDPRHPRSIISPEQGGRLEAWLRRQDPARPKFIVSGSVFVPGLRDADYSEWGNPHARAYPSRADSWQGFPEDRARLVGLVAACKQQNVVFVSGDYHCSARMRLRIDDGTAAYDAYAIVVRPFYAPFHLVNESRQTVVQAGTLKYQGTPGLRYRGEVDEGSGYSEITVQQDGSGAWRIGVQEYDQLGAPAGAPTELTRLPAP